MPQRGEEIAQQLKMGQTDLFNFNRITACNIGNPQAVGQGYISHNREVLAACLYPALLQSDSISKDAKERAGWLLNEMSTPVGAYTSNSKGHMTLRKEIAKFIEKRDGVESNPNNIFMTNGASEGVRICFKMIARNYKQGIMIPIPQYPLYSAQTTLDGGTMVRYYLDESKAWGVDVEDIRKRIKNAKDVGIDLRAIVVINPGNPTGNVLRRGNIEDIIRVSHENGLIILADEVY